MQYGDGVAIYLVVEYALLIQEVDMADCEDVQLECTQEKCATIQSAATRRSTYWILWEVDRQSCWERMKVPRLHFEAVEGDHETTL